MKWYLSCLFLFFGVSIVCFFAGFTLQAQKNREESLRSAEASLEARERQLREQTEEVPAANRWEIRHELGDPTAADEYYLVCEDGFLLVFQRDKETICLYTHIPITDFPAAEREKIREGIGFSSMIEVMNYLESYTS